MDFNITLWLERLTGALRDAFGDRILYIGHNGSYARGEASEASDIDVNTVLDTLEMEDLRKYRRIIKEMPSGEKACGFICGRKEIAAWPAHELFQFLYGSKTLCGSPEGIVRMPSEEDIRDNIRNTSSMIYHEACHRYIYAADIAAEAEALQPAYKFAFFVLQEWFFLKEKKYIPTKKELLPLLEGENREILDTLINWDMQAEGRRKDTEKCFAALKNWSGAMLQEMA